MPASWKLSIDLDTLFREWQSLPRGQRRAFIEARATELGKSHSALYRALARRHGKRKEVEREATVSEALIREVAKLKVLAETQKLKGKRQGCELSTHEALQILIEEGWREATGVSVSTVNRQLVRAGYRVPTPRVRVQAHHACQQFQIDFSRSKYFQIVGPDPERPGDWLLKVSGKELHYKLDDRRLRTWLVQIKDEYAGIRLIQAYPATSESALLGINFLNWCFNRTEDDHLMRHLPERLKSDQGSFMKSNEVKTLLAALEIEPKMSRPYNSESQGKVERGWGSLWQTFEAVQAVRLAREHGDGAIIRLSTYNHWVHKHLIAEHDQAHTTIKDCTRGQAYQQSILQVRPHEVETDLLNIACRTWERVADLTRMLTIENVPFEVPAQFAGCQIRIHRNRLGEFIGEPINRHGESFTLRPYRFADLDHFENRPKQTFAQEIEQDVRAEQAAKKVKPLRPKTKVRTPKSVFTETKTTRPAEAPMPKLETLAYIKRTLAAAYIDATDLDLSRRVGRGLTLTDADRLIQDIQNLYRKAI